jgi:thioredoxin reductase
VVDAGEPRNAPAAQMFGYLSRDGFPAADLVVVGRREVESYHGALIDGRAVAVTSVPPVGSGTRFTVSLADGTELAARKVLIATGLHDEIPSIDGARQRWGRDLLHCPYCHGYEVRDQPLAVLGGTAGAVQHAQLVRQWSDDVALLPHTDTLAVEQHEQLAARGIGVVDGVVRGLVVVNDQLTGVEFEDGRVVNRSAVFVRPLMVANDDLARGVGCLIDERGWVVTDAVGRTSVRGVWIAGNAGNPRAQVITAAGEGSAAAIALHTELIEDDVADAVRSQRLATTTQRSS